MIWIRIIAPKISRPATLSAPTRGRFGFTSPMLRAAGVRGRRARGDFPAYAPERTSVLGGRLAVLGAQPGFDGAVVLLGGLLGLADPVTGPADRPDGHEQCQR